MCSLHGGEVIALYTKDSVPTASSYFVIFLAPNRQLQTINNQNLTVAFSDLSSHLELSFVQIRLLYVHEVPGESICTQAPWQQPYKCRRPCLHNLSNSQWFEH